MSANNFPIGDVFSAKAFQQLDAFKLKLNTTNDQVESLIKIFIDLDKTVGAAKGLKELNAAQQQLNKAQLEAVSISKKQVDEQEAVEQVEKASTQQERDLQAALKTTAKSIAEAREQNKLLTASRDALNVSDKEGVSRLNELNAKIVANNTLIKTAEAYNITQKSAQTENASPLTEGTMEQVKAEQKKITDAVQEELDKRQIALSQQLEKGELSYKEYKKAIEKEQREALAKQLKAAIEYYEKLMTLEGISTEQQQTALKELAKLYQQVSESNEKAVTKENETLEHWWDGMNWAEKGKFILEQLEKVWTNVSKLVSTSMQNQITEVDNLKKNLDKTYEKQLKQVKNMGYTSRQEELETARIKREHEAETEKLEEKKAALQTKQARWNKANSIVQATISGALAIMQAYAQSGPIVGSVFAGIIAAITAAQIAVIAAQKIPEYAEGRKGGKAELAIVGDGGQAEVIEKKGGMAYVTPSAPTLTRLATGDRVWPSVQEYLFNRDAGEGTTEELRKLRRESRQDNEQLAYAMQNINTKLAVTSAGLVWLRGRKNLAHGRG